MTVPNTKFHDITSWRRLRWGIAVQSSLVSLLFGVACAAMCQSFAPGVSPAESAKDRRGEVPWTACNRLAPAVSPECISQQIEPSSSAHSFLTLKSPKPASGFFLAQNNSIITLAPHNSLWPSAKCEPIPTQWPKAKIEKIPTEWPNARIVLLDSRPSTLLP
jgi:hypothetical protein